MQFTLLGTPHNRRVHFFQDALRKEGHPPASVVSWNTLLQDPDNIESLLSGDSLRIDSPEQDFEAYKQIIGYGASYMEHEAGEWIAPEDALHLPPEQGGLRYHRQCYLGFRAWLEELEHNIDEHPCFPRPIDIARMSDKALCYSLFTEAQLPIPKAIDVHSYDAVQQAMLELDIQRVFIKLRHGSSASGIGAYFFDGAREVLLTSIVKRGEHKLNSLRLRKHTERLWIQPILEWVYKEGAHTEEWLPKMQLNGCEFDLRIVVIGGRACHVIPRVSFNHNPMTNLHFGNERGDRHQVRQHVGIQRWQNALQLAEDAAALFPNSLCIGTDIMWTPEGEAILLEVNAFGDLLPGIEWQGMSTYEAQLHAFLQTERWNTASLDTP